MSEQVTEIVTLYLGRGLRGEPLAGDEQPLEVSVDLADLTVELDEAMIRYQAAPGRVWLPLTSSLAGAPVLVWDGDDGLVPTHVPVPPVGVEDRSPGGGEATAEKEAK